MVVGAVPLGLTVSLTIIKKSLPLKCPVHTARGDMIPTMKIKVRIIRSGMYAGLKKGTCRPFQELIATNRIDVNFLTTHTFKLDDVASAYDMIMEKSEPFIGILIEYDTEKKIGEI